METWKFNPAIRAAAEKFITDNDLTRAEFTARLAGNFSPTRVAKYLNLDKDGNLPEADAPKVEAAINAYLRHVARGNELKASLFDNSISRDIAGVLRQIRRTGDIGVIYGDGGLGKTCGAILFARDNPDTLFTTAKAPFCCSDWAILKLLFAEFNNSVSDKWTTALGINRWDWLERNLRGTERLWILDDAELLDASALRLIFSLHNSTGIPIALIGNAEIVDKIRAIDKSGKMVSRIGISHSVRTKNDEQEIARKLLTQFAPEATDHLLEEVTQLVGEFGHCRRVRKQLTLAVKLRESAKDKDWAANFKRAAASMLN